MKNKLLIAFFFLLFIVGFSGWLASKTQSDIGPVLILPLFGGGCLLFAYFAYHAKATQSPQEENATEKYEFDKVPHPSFTFTMAGAAYRDATTRHLLTLLPLHSEVLLEPEPTNPYDSNAIKVMLPDNIHIGYVPALTCEKVLEIMNKYPNYHCSIIDKRPGEKAPWIDIYINFNADEF